MTMSSKIKFDKDMLLLCMERDGFFTNGEKYDKITRETRISFFCLCGQLHEKSLRCIWNQGGMCRSCTNCVAKKKTIQTNLKKYGVEHTMQCKEVREKTKKTCLEKYGVEHTLQCKEVRDKAKETCLKKYGVENPAQCDEIKKKMLQTCMEKYGVEYLLQSEKGKDKFKQTCLQNHGVEHPWQCDEIKDKSKKTWMANYGVENPFQCETIKHKIQQTCLKIYGVNHPAQCEEIKEKKKETCLKKYGVENHLQCDVVQDKIKETCLKKYGVTHPSQCEVIKEKRKQTHIQKYGVENAMQNKEIAEKALRSAYRCKEYLFSDGIVRKVQGYEPFALDILVQMYSSSNIITSRTEVPEVWYEIHNKKHRYFPDIYIKSINKIIEVKSTWTYKMAQIDLWLKASSCRALGFDFEVWIFDAKKNLVICDE